MRTSELQKKILSAIRNKLSTRELTELCTLYNVSLSGSKRNMQDRFESFIHDQSNNQLVLINDKVDSFINNTKRISSSVTQPTSDKSKYDNEPDSFHPDTLSDALLASAPIDLREEISMIDRKSVVVVRFTNYSSALSSVPTELVTGVNERVRNVRIPNMLPNVNVHTSPFYCCPVCLHPLSMLVPKIMPNVNQNNKTMSDATFQFSVSDDALKLITRNCINLGSNKVDYKWQVLLKFVAIEPHVSVPIPKQSVNQMIPPYLIVSVNGKPTPLWEILPSNCRSKEGKRHPKPVNITDKLNNKDRSKNFYPQTITISWWQTPEVFQYYYIGVYLERKLSVREILDLFTSNRHVNIRPIEYSLNLIRCKLNDPKYRHSDADDDLVVSSVLPISLSCPVGRSRIEIPIRSLNCQHLQCFDAQLFLSMNERRSIWQCPVCDVSATPNELFCDKYFQKILREFKDNDEINDINVHSDGTYTAVLKQNEEKLIPDTKVVKPVQAAAEMMIVLDDSDEDESEPKKVPLTEKSRSTSKSNHSSKSTNHEVRHSKDRTSSSHSSSESANDNHRHSHKSSQSKHNEKSSSSKHKSSSTHKTTSKSTNCVTTTSNENNNAHQLSLSQAFDSAIARSSVVSRSNQQPVTQSHIYHESIPHANSSAVYTTISSFSVPPPLYAPAPFSPRMSNLINLTESSQPPTYNPLQNYNIIPAPSPPPVPVSNVISSSIQAPILTPMPPSIFQAQHSQPVHYKTHFAAPIPVSYSNPISLSNKVLAVSSVQGSRVASPQIGNVVSAISTIANMMPPKLTPMTSQPKEHNAPSVSASIEKQILASLSLSKSSVTNVSVTSEKRSSVIKVIASTAKIPTSNQVLVSISKDSISSSKTKFVGSPSIKVTTSTSNENPIVSVIRTSISGSNASEKSKQIPVTAATTITGTAPINIGSIKEPIQCPYRKILHVTNRAPDSVASSSQVSDISQDTTIAVRKSSDEDRDAESMKRNEALKGTPSVNVSTSGSIITQTTAMSSEVQSTVTTSTLNVPALYRQSLDRVRTLADVVRTLATDEVVQPDSSLLNKNLITMPICCPVVIVDRPSSSLITEHKEIVEKSVKPIPKNKSPRKDNVIEAILGTLNAIDNESAPVMAILPPTSECEKMSVSESARNEDVVATINDGPESPIESVNMETIPERPISPAEAFLEKSETVIGPSQETLAQKIIADSTIISIDLTSDDDDSDGNGNNNDHMESSPISGVAPPNTVQTITQVISQSLSTPHNSPTTITDTNAKLPINMQSNTATHGTSPIDTQNNTASNAKLPITTQSNTATNGTFPIVTQNITASNATVLIATQSNIATKATLPIATQSNIATKATLPIATQSNIATKATPRSQSSGKLTWCSMSNPNIRKAFLNVRSVTSNNMVPTHPTPRNIVAQTSTSISNSKSAPVTNRKVNAIDRRQPRDSSPNVKRLRLTNIEDDHLNEDNVTQRSDNRCTVESRL